MKREDFLGIPFYTKEQFHEDMKLPFDCGERSILEAEDKRIVEEIRKNFKE